MKYESNKNYTIALGHITNSEKAAHDKFFRHDGFLFLENKLCIPNCSIRDLLVRESHGARLMGHFVVAKTLGVLQEHFYWLRMKRDVEKICGRCITCRQAKSQVQHPMAFTQHFLFLVNLGLIFQWTLC